MEYEREIEALYTQIETQRIEIARLKAEIERLRQWGREALAILDQWEAPQATKIVRKMRKIAPDGIKRYKK